MVVVNNAEIGDHIRLERQRFLTKKLRGGIDANIDHIKPCALEHDPYQVFADIVQIALDGADQHLAGIRKTFESRCGLMISKPPFIALALSSISGI